MGTDRVETTTLLFIFDAREKQLLHLETVETDVPSAVGTTFDYTTGRTLDEDAFNRLVELLGAAPGE